MERRHAYLYICIHKKYIVKYNIEGKCSFANLNEFFLSLCRLCSLLARVYGHKSEVKCAYIHTS